MPTNNFPGIGTKTGTDYNFYNKKDVIATSFGGDTVSGKQPDMVIRFQTTTLMMLNEGSGIIEFSFNGINVHGELNSATQSNALSFDNRMVNRIWFRIKEGSSGPITVSVTAW